MKGYIYKLTSPSGKCYIGQTINLTSRFNSYKRCDCKSQPAIYNAIKKYGFNNFSFEVIQELEFDNRQDLKKEMYIVEAELIVKHKSFTPLCGYNICIGAGYYADLYFNKIEKEINQLEYDLFEAYLNDFGFYDKKIYQFKDDKLINIFNTIKEASEQCHVASSGINNNISGRIKSSGGFKWYKI